MFVRLAVAENGGVAIRAHAARVRSAVAINTALWSCVAASGTHRAVARAMKPLPRRAGILRSPGGAQACRVPLRPARVLGHHPPLPAARHRPSTPPGIRSGERFARIRFVFDGHERGRGMFVAQEFLRRPCCLQLRRFPVRSTMRRPPRGTHPPHRPPAELPVDHR